MYFEYSHVIDVIMDIIQKLLWKYKTNGCLPWFFSQYSNDYLYDDEYDDRDDDEAPIKVDDNPLDKEILICNPNREELASDTSYSSDDYDESNQPISKSGPSEGLRNNRYKWQLS